MTGKEGPKAYLFNVDVLIEAENNAQAMEHLISLLNQKNVPDFNILSGSQLGTLIDQMRNNAPSGLISPPSKPRPVDKPTSAINTANTAPVAAAKSSNIEGNPLLSMILKNIDEKKLTRINVNKGKGVKLSVPGRILNFDEAAQVITVYHVDEKQVYTFKLNEIDDLSD